MVHNCLPTPWINRTSTNCWRVLNSRARRDRVVIGLLLAAFVAIPVGISPPFRIASPAAAATAPEPARADGAAPRAPQTPFSTPAQTPAPNPAVTAAVPDTTAAAARRATIRVTAAEHPGFARVVLDAPGLTPSISRDGDRLLIRFSGEFAFAPLPPMPRGVVAARTVADGLERTLS